MNLEPYRQMFEEAELAAELAEAQAVIVDLKHMIDQLDLAIANYQDAWTLTRNSTRMDPL